jgi:membrane protease YdiL (CAAX protease family)
MYIFFQLLSSCMLGLLLPITQTTLFKFLSRYESINQFTVYIVIGAIVLLMSLLFKLQGQLLNIKSPAIRPNFILIMLSGVAVSILVGDLFSKLSVYIFNLFFENIEFSHAFHPNVDIRLTNPILFPWLVMLIVPVLEEIWYRVLVLNPLLKVCGKASAILVTSVLFTLSHTINVVDLISLSRVAPAHFIAGIVLCIIRLECGLIWAIAAHLIQNAPGIILSNEIQMTIFTEYLIAGISSILFCVSLLRSKSQSVGGTNPENR